MMTLTEKDREIFVSALLPPSTPRGRLKKAVSRYEKLMVAKTDVHAGSPAYPRISIVIASGREQSEAGAWRSAKPSPSPAA